MTNKKVVFSNEVRDLFLSESLHPRLTTRRFAAISPASKKGNSILYAGNASMSARERIANFHADMTAWRRDIHAHPELGFQETRTASTGGESAQLLHQHRQWQSRGRLRGAQPRLLFQRRGAAARRLVLRPSGGDEAEEGLAGAQDRRFI